MTGLEFRFLGDFEVRKDGTPLPLPPSKKTRALLAYLSLQPRQFRREFPTKAGTAVRGETDAAAGSGKRAARASSSRVAMATACRLCAPRSHLEIGTRAQSCRSLATSLRGRGYGPRRANHKPRCQLFFAKTKKPRSLPRSFPRPGCRVCGRGSDDYAARRRAKEGPWPVTRISCKPLEIRRLCG